MDNKERKVLVTGGAGYIGSVLCRVLLRRGVSVRVIDNLTFGGESLLGLLPEPEFEFIEGDIRSREDRASALAGVDGVAHLAAIVGDPACARDPESARAINGEATERLIEDAIAAGVRRFVFASTCSNYGRMPDPEGFVDEGSELRPVSLYAELKVGIERLLMQTRRDGFAAVCLRFATAFGLSPRPRFDLTVNEFTRDLVCGRNLEVFGEQFWRPYCHTTDLAEACALALEAPEAAVKGRAFNVGSTAENFRKKDLVALILRETPEASGLVSYVHREEDPRDYRVRFERIEASLGFRPRRRVADGIREIAGAIRSGMIADPFSERYRNLR